MATSIQTIKVLILGNSGVGKTNIMERYTVNQFSDNWISTIGIDFRAKVISIGEKTVKLQIWDTAGQERYRTIVAGYYRGAHAIILVYDLTDKTSFRDVITWMHEIEKNADSGIVTVLVANKLDLESQREVTFDQGKKLADDHQMKFFEVSAKANLNIEDVFLCTTSEVLENPTFQKRLEDGLKLKKENDNGGKKKCC